MNPASQTSKKSARRRLFAALAVLSYATTFSACQTRLKEAFVEGSTNLLYSFLDPANFLGDDDSNP